jgi:hypothetical protein
MWSSHNGSCEKFNLLGFNAMVWGKSTTLSISLYISMHVYICILLPRRSLGCEFIAAMWNLWLKKTELKQGQILRLAIQFSLTIIIS